MLTLSQTTETIIDWTTSCMNELHLERILFAFENCVRKPFEDNTNKDEIALHEAMVLDAIQKRKIQLDLHKMD